MIAYVYRRHHDTIPELTTMLPGPRVFTFFMYLSGSVSGPGRDLLRNEAVPFDVPDSLLVACHLTTT